VGISPNLEIGAVGNKDELVRFLGQKVKGQGHSEITYGQISTLGCVFSPIPGTHGHALMISPSTQSGPDDTDAILKVVDSQDKVTGNTSPKCTFLTETRRSMVAVDDHLV